MNSTLQQRIGSSTAVILAGGQATRMGRMKSGLLWNGRSFLEVLQAELADFPRCRVSVDRRERFDPSLDVIEDRYPGCGPLGALYSCLAAADTPLVFVAACDMPLLTKELVHWLYGQWTPGDEVCIAKTRDGKLHPLCGIYRAELAPAIRQSLDGGERRVMRFLESRALRTAQVPPALEPQLTNVNTPEAYRALCDGAYRSRPV